MTYYYAVVKTSGTIAMAAQGDAARRWISVFFHTLDDTAYQSK